MFQRITVNPQQMGGVPCIRGLRIPVATVVGMVADGMTTDEILTAYPDLQSDEAFPRIPSRRENCASVSHSWMSSSPIRMLFSGWLGTSSRRIGT